MILIFVIVIISIVLAVNKISEYKQQKQIDKYWQNIVDEWNSNPNHLVKMEYR
jgi:hypothetical protein